MGRVLLAALDDDALAVALARADLRPITPHTVSSVAALLDVVAGVRNQGWCLLEEELEAGIQCVAAPVHDASGAVVAAVTVSSHTTRVPPEELRERILPALLHAARDIDDDLRRRG
jgi:IclR family pca regulon transcriptional regulator